MPKGSNPEFTSKTKQWSADEDFGDERANPAPIAIKYPETLYQALKALPNRSAWIREAVAEKARREGIVPPSYGLKNK
jgi:hypothetical protein